MVSLSFFAFVCLFALSQSVEQQPDGKPVTTSVKSCPLQHGMSRAHCVFPESVDLVVEPASVSNADDEADKSRDGLDKSSVDDIDWDNLVPERTFCMAYSSENRSAVLMCAHGWWILTGNSLHSAQWSHLRHRRSTSHDTEDFWEFIAAGLISVVGGLIATFTSSGSGGSSNHNEAPSIDCPSISKTYTAPEGKESVQVIWKEATATDEEDGSVDVRRTSSAHSGQYFTEGTHQVSYETQDSNRKTDSCSTSFTVVVHRCSSSHTYKSEHMEDPFCQPPSSGLPVFGTVCSYECEPGYDLSGVNQTKCMASKTWRDPKPTCIAKKCRPPMNISHGSLACGNGTDRYDYTAMCSVNCNAGFQVEGADNVTCQLTEQWSNPGTCKDKQPPFVTCVNNIHAFAGPKRAAVSVTYPLPQAHDNSGDPVQVTSDIPSGTLFPPGQTTVSVNALDSSGNLATCKFVVSVTVKSCPPFKASDFSNFTCTDDHVYGSECTTICDPGHELIGNETRICLENQTWSGQQPVCQRMSCPKPDLDPNGLMQYDCQHGYFYGESCALTCSDGNTVLGDHSIICEGNSAGITGPKVVWNWRGSVVPSCPAGSCPKLNTPRNGALVCSPLGNIGETCVISCDENYMHPSSAPERYNCMKPLLTWDPDSFVPACYGRRPPNEANIKPDFYYSSGSCSSNSTEIRQNFLTALQGSYLWQAYCTNGINCTIANVEVTCYSAAGRRRRDANSGTASSAVTIQISPTISLGQYQNQGSRASTRAFYDNVAMDIGDTLQKEVDNGQFDIPEIGTFDTLSAGLAQFGCPPGTILDQATMSCGGCGEGYIYDSDSQSCLACPVGTYQDQEIGYTCIACPLSTTTRNSRATSASQCHNFCAAGTFSSSGYEPCDVCPKGSYQSNKGMTSCDFCPFGMSTLKSRTMSQAECLFFSIMLTNETQGPLIKQFDSRPDTITIMTWVHLTSTSPRTTLNFDLDPQSVSPGTAHLSLDGLHIYMIPASDQLAKTIRTWYHLAAVYNNGSVSLYVNGANISHVENVDLSGLWKKTVYFSGSPAFQSIEVSGLQMSSSVLTEAEIQQFATSCDARLDFRSNILTVDEPAETVIIQNSCDDTDDCVTDSCNSHGTCIDGLSQFTCLCEDPWSGSTCQVTPDYCIGHQCANGATCVNDHGQKNYTCVCVPPFSGSLCQDMPVCHLPQLRAGHRSWNCVKNNINHGQKCKIVCDDDLVLLPNIDNNFECGPSTNYSWSHQTVDNPTGILPDCSRPKFPVTAAIEVKVTYKQIDCSSLAPESAILKHVDDNLANIFTCMTVQMCYFRTEAKSTCTVKRRKKRAPASFSVIISLYSYPPSVPQYWSSKSGLNGSSDMAKLSTVIEMTQHMTNASDSIFNFTMQGQQYVGHFEAAEWKSICSLGTQMHLGICVDCPTGYYSSIRGGMCQPCDVGFYQDQPAKTECFPCVNGTTVGKGSYSDHFCI